MNRNVTKITAVLILLILISCTQKQDSQIEDLTFNEWTYPSGPYLGETPPGMIPKVFAKFLADPLDHKHSAPIFSNDGKELYFSAYLNNINPQRILVSKLVDSVWTKPELVSFSSNFSEGGPRFSHDNNRLYFYSKRPRLGSTEPPAYSTLWFVERINDNWSEPKPFLPFDGFEFGVYTSNISKNGAVYASVESEDPRDFDFWVSYKDGDSYSKPTRIDEPISEKLSYESSCTILENGQTMIFTRYTPNTPNNISLFMAQKNQDSTWSQPKRMGDMINENSARFVTTSPDGKYLFFESYRLGNEEMFWVDAKVINYLKTEDLNLIDKLRQTLLTSGKEATIIGYNKLKEKHSAFYIFDEKLFNSISNILLDEKNAEAASWAIELNQQLFQEKPSLLLQYRIAVQKDFNNVSQFYNKFDSLAKQTDNIVEIDMNRLGYRLLQLDLIDAAYVTLEMNTKLFPASGNVFDSFAEITLTKGDSAQAILLYKKSLELSPNNENAKNILNDLGVELEN